MTGILLDNDFGLRIEPKYDGNGLITSGLVLGDINYQRVRLIVLSQKGEIKENPLLGFGIHNYINSPVVEVKQRFINELEKELAMDGIKAKIAVGEKLTEFSVDI